MSTPAFSLILATVGRTDELDRMFSSLAAQTFVDFEVIVVDQNQDQRLVPHLERARAQGLKLRHLPHYPPNLAAARNAGIAAATGTWIGFPDDDCWYDPSVLERLAACFQSPERPDGVIARWVEQNEQPEQPAKLTWERASAFRDVPVCSITLFCSRKLCTELQGFDARFGVGQWFGAGEETDFLLRALRRNASFVYEPKATVHHAAQSAPAALTTQARIAMLRRARGTGALYAKHHLSWWVITRGILAPMIKPLLQGNFGARLRNGWHESMGRYSGMRRWRNGESNNMPGKHA